MSNYLAIAAVTATLRNLLQTRFDQDSDLGGASVTTRPPDKARGPNDNGNQLNLFLYQAALNGAWRNRDVPGKVKPGETGHPPLALTLHYLITAWGQNNDDVAGHHVLGQAMSLLHDHTVLEPEEIQLALPNNDLHEQVERVRITAQPLTLEELSKLWTTFQTQYRISAAYQASAVLVDSLRSAKAAFPVLQRGKKDRGPAAVASPPPRLLEARPSGSLPGVRLGEDLTLRGQHLDAGLATARLSSPRLPEPLEIAPETGGTADRLVLRLLGPADDADALARWAPGLYTAALVVQRSGDLPAWTTNGAPFLLAPSIQVAPLEAPPGDLTISVECSPRLVPGQAALLLFGDRQVKPTSVDTPADVTQPSKLEFLVEDVPEGEYAVRLRVDGVDSIPAVLAGTPPVLQLDPAQTVKVKP